MAARCRALTPQQQAVSTHGCHSGCDRPAAFVWEQSRRITYRCKDCPFRDFESSTCTCSGCKVWKRARRKWRISMKRRLAQDVIIPQYEMQLYYSAQLLADPSPSAQLLSQG